MIYGGWKNDHDLSKYFSMRWLGHKESGPGCVGIAASGKTYAPRQVDVGRGFWDGV